MTADLYCSRADVNRRIPLGSIESPAGIVASSLAATDTITFDGHGLETDDPVTVRAVAGGTLSAPLVAGTTYYVRRITNATFQLAATAGGDAINLTSDGESMIVAREPDYDLVIEECSRHADAFLPAHLVPMGRTEPVHPTVRWIVADLAAAKIIHFTGKDSALVTAAELAANSKLERFAAGIPLRGADTTASANLAVRASLSATTDQRGWGSGTLP